MRSFFGLVNQLGDFSPDIATAASPLRSLLRPSDSFFWSPDHDNAFEDVKLPINIIIIIIIPPLTRELIQTGRVDGSVDGVGLSLGT